MKEQLTLRVMMLQRISQPVEVDSSVLEPHHTHFIVQNIDSDSTGIRLSCKENTLCRYLFRFQQWFVVTLPTPTTSLCVSG